MILFFHILGPVISDLMMDICNPPLLWIDSRCYRVTEAPPEDYVVEAGYTGEFETCPTEVRLDLTTGY